MVEQLDVATTALREESREADRLCLSVAAVKRETAVAELAAVEAQARLAGKAFGTIGSYSFTTCNVVSLVVAFSCLLFSCPGVADRSIG